MRVKKLRIAVGSNGSKAGENSRAHALALAEAVQRKNDLEDRREAVNAEMAGLQVTRGIHTPIPRTLTPRIQHSKTHTRSRTQADIVNQQNDEAGPSARSQKRWQQLNSLQVCGRLGRLHAEC